MARKPTKSKMGTIPQRKVCQRACNAAIALFTYGGQGESGVGVASGVTMRTDMGVCVGSGTNVGAGVGVSAAIGQGGRRNRQIRRRTAMFKNLDLIDTPPCDVLAEAKLFRLAECPMAHLFYSRSSGLSRANRVSGTGSALAKNA